MNTFITLLCVTFAVLDLKAQQTEAEEHLSDITNGLYVKYVIFKENRYAAIGDRSHYIIISTNNINTRIFFLNEEYACKLALYNSSGVEMPRTALGKRIGRKFDEIKESKKEYIEIEKDGTLVGSFIYTIGSMAHNVHPLKELFIVKSNGRYRASIQIQFIKQTKVNGTNNNELVRCNKIEYLVERKEY